jgi:hypothetical protein
MSDAGVERSRVQKAEGQKKRSKAKNHTKKTREKRDGNER